MKLSEEIAAVVDKTAFHPNPDEWTSLQIYGLEWGRKAFALEQQLNIEKRKHLDTANWAMEQQDRANALEQQLAEMKEALGECAAVFGLTADRNPEHERMMHKCDALAGDQEP